MSPRQCVEDCHKFSITDLFRRRRLKFDGVTEGVWRGLRWRVLLSDQGSRLALGDRTWELVPIIRSGSTSGVWWLVRDATGRRCTTVLLTPDGRLGTRWELRARYRSQTLWTAKKQRAHQRHKIIERLEGRTDFSWVVNHPDYVPRRPRGSRRMTKAAYDRTIKRLEQYRAPESRSSDPLKTARRVIREPFATLFSKNITIKRSNKHDPYGVPPSR